MKLQFLKVTSIKELSLTWYGLAPVVRTSAPPLMLEIRRPEMVMACQEHLLRKAEKVGYEGIHKSKIRHQVMDLIKEFEN